MGFLDSICSGVSSFVSSVGSAISSGLSAAASWCGEKFGAVIDAGKNILGTVGGVAGSLLQGLGLWGAKETPEDVGDRALQAHEQSIFPESFERFSEYMEKLRNFDLDPKKTEESTTDQKIFKGLEVAGRALEDKFNAPTGGMANVWVLAGANPEYFTSDRFHSLLNSGVDMASVVDYFEGKLGGGESLEVEDQLVDTDQATYPGKDPQSSRQELYAAVETAKNILN
jgi:hypothetical protein